MQPKGTWVVKVKSHIQLMWSREEPLKMIKSKNGENNARLIRH